MLERSEQQIRAASGLEELLQITHFEDWKLWRCRLKVKSLASADSRSASHRATRFAATFYDIETLKGRCVCVEANPCPLSVPNAPASSKSLSRTGTRQGEEKGVVDFIALVLLEHPGFLCLLHKEIKSK